MAAKKLTKAQKGILACFSDENFLTVDSAARAAGKLTSRGGINETFHKAIETLTLRGYLESHPEWSSFARRTNRYRLTDAGREALDAANAERAESTATIKAAYDARKADAARADSHEPPAEPQRTPAQPEYQPNSGCAWETATNAIQPAPDDDISNTLKQVATLPPSDEVQRRLADMNARIEAEEKEEAARAEAHKDALYVVWSKKLCKPLTIPMPFNEAIDFAPNWDGIILRDVDELTARMDALKFEKQGQELQDALDESRRIAAQQVEDAARRIAELEAALHFYADAGNYPIGLGGVHYADFAISDDEGDRARAALGLKALEG